MLRKLVSLLTTLLLLCTPAMAEEAAAAGATASTPYGYPAGPFTPAPEDFLGTWVVRYGVKAGKLLSQEDITGGGLPSIVISADSMTSYTDNEPISTLTYAIDGSTLTASDGSVMQMPARNVLYVHHAAATTSFILLRSNEPAYSPFYGDWQLLMVCSYGEEMDVSIGEDMPVVCRFDADGFHAIYDGEVSGTLPVTYAGDQCTLSFGDSVIVFTVDGAGLLRGVPSDDDGVMFLIPTAE